MHRRKHPRLKVGALFCVLDIKMNSSDLVSRQMRQEDVHPLLGSPQRGSVTHFSNNERRAATRQARRMPARLNIGGFKPAACATIATSKLRMIRNRWAAAKNAPVT